MAKVSELQHQAIHFGLNAFHRYSVHAHSILLCLTMLLSTPSLALHYFDS